MLNQKTISFDDVSLEKNPVEKIKKGAQFLLQSPSTAVRGYQLGFPKVCMQMKMLASEKSPQYDEKAAHALQEFLNNVEDTLISKSLSSKEEMLYTRVINSFFL